MKLSEAENAVQFYLIGTVQLNVIEKLKGTRIDTKAVKFHSNQLIKELESRKVFENLKLFFNTEEKEKDCLTIIDEYERIAEIISQLPLEFLPSLRKGMETAFETLKKSRHEDSNS